MEIALQSAKLSPEQIDYVNAHATSTPAGDELETQAITDLFGAHAKEISISATKSMTGHGQGAAGAMEAIFCLLMLDNDFITPSINVETLAEGINDGEIATESVENAGLDSVMTNSFGFGGTNGSMILSKYNG